jgi:hypothetical protein
MLSDASFVSHPQSRPSVESWAVKRLLSDVVHNIVMNILSSREEVSFQGIYVMRQAHHVGSSQVLVRRCVCKYQIA